MVSRKIASGCKEGGRRGTWPVAWKVMVVSVGGVNSVGGGEATRCSVARKDEVLMRVLGTAFLLRRLAPLQAAAPQID